LMLGPIRMAQLISLVLIAIAGLALVIMYKRTSNKKNN
jgi:prolipoprotein diacylglyceryltransferase